MLDLVFVECAAFWDRAAAELTSRGWWQWFAATVPLLIFGDVLWYYVPPILVAILHPFTRDRTRAQEQRHRQFLSRLPRVSVIIPGRNEEQGIANCIRSLLEQEYSNLEIIVVDDNSTDRMYEIANAFAQKGLIRLVRNNAALGRGGKASAGNLGIRVSTGEFLLAVDADTTFDRHLIVHMIGPFCDPKVGAVAGNLKVRNRRANFVTRMQALEYMVGIGLAKRWTDMRGVTHLVSGALGAYRREAVLAVGMYDAELAEDTDLTLKVQRAGWGIRFAPCALAMTRAPETWRAVGRQRFRWDRGGLRTYYHKHGSLLNPFRYRWALTIELAAQYFFEIIATLLYPAYIAYMLVTQPWTLLFVMVVAYLVCIAGSVATAVAAIAISERRAEEWPLVFWSPFLPLFKEYLRWVRLKAVLCEIFHIHYEDPFLPDSAWRCAPRW